MGGGVSISLDSPSLINQMLVQWFETKPELKTIQGEILNLFGCEVTDRVGELILGKLVSLHHKKFKINRLRRYICYLLDDQIQQFPFPIETDTVKAIEAHEGPFGVSLQFIYHFIDKYQISETMTTAEVVKNIIIPETTSTKQTFIDAKLGEKYPLYWSDFRTGYRGNEFDFGDNTTFRRHAFVSHAWSMPFRRMIDTVQDVMIATWNSSVPFFMYCPDHNYIEEYDSQVILWLDIFCKNQHLPSPAMDEFHKAMEAPGEVIAIFYPTITPIALSRIWCLFELFTAIKLKLQIQVASDDSLYQLIANYHLTKRLVNDDGVSNRFERIGHDGIIEYIKQFLVIDVESAQATVASDIELIIGLIKESVGVDEMTRMLYMFMANDIMGRDYFANTDHSLACFDGESVVSILAKGIISNKLVQDLSIGDEVLTEAGNYQRIELITVDHIPGGILEMCLTKEGVYITPEHPIYLESSERSGLGSGEWILPKDIYEVKKYPMRRVYNIELDQSGTNATDGGGGNAICLNTSLIAITLGHNLRIFPETDKEFGWGWRNNPARKKYL